MADTDSFAEFRTAPRVPPAPDSLAAKYQRLETFKINGMTPFGNESARHVLDQIHGLCTVLSNGFDDADCVERLPHSYSAVSSAHAIFTARAFEAVSLLAAAAAHLMDVEDGE